MIAKGKYQRRRNVTDGHFIRMLSVKRISELYRFHPNTIRAWVNNDKLRHVRRGPGGKIYISKEDVDRYIQIWYE